MLDKFKFPEMLKNKFLPRSNKFGKHSMLYTLLVLIDLHLPNKVSEKSI